MVRSKSDSCSGLRDEGECPDRNAPLSDATKQHPLLQCAFLWYCIGVYDLLDFLNQKFLRIGHVWQRKLQISTCRNFRY